MNDVEPSKLWRRAPSVALIAAAYLWSSAARAADDRDAAAAEALFREGKRLLALGDHDAACPKLAESYRLDPATGALLATALCYERAGKLASAWVAYTDAAARAKNEGHAERERSARARAVQLEPRLPRLVVVADADSTEELVVLRDGIRIGQAAWGSPMPVDPGERSIEARAPGKEAYRTTVRAVEGRETRVEIPPLEDLPAEAEPSAAIAFEPPRAAPVGVSDRPEYWTGLRGAGAVMGGVGVVSLGVGAAFGIRALILKSDSSDGCDADDFCEPRAYETRRDAVRAGNVATIAGIAGFALGATGLALFILGAPDDEGSVALELNPLVTGGLSASLGGSF